MTDEPKKDPRARMRNLLGSTSPLTRLPKKDDDSAAFLPPEEEVTKSVIVEQKKAPQPSPKPAPVSKGLKFNFGPAFWTIASILSMTVNVILVIVLLGVLVNLRGLKLTNVMDMGVGLLGDLYTNFEKMDRAHITTTIPVQTTIPVKFDLQLNQQTNVVLSQDVTIDNARVTVNTGGLNISNALTTIVLPQGTTLPVVLNLTVPVDTTVPVVLNVNVDIPLSQTQLHEPFVGLREVVKPFYCILNRNAVNMDGQSICQ